MILLSQQTSGRWQEHLHEIRHSPYDAEGAQRRLLLYVGVGRLDQSLHLGGQVTSHFGGRDGTEGA